MLFLLSFFIVQKKDVIFQEGNPIPLAVAMSKMIFQNKEIDEVKGTEEVNGIYGYLVNGWRFIEKNEISNALVFKKGNEYGKEWI
ncbi:hypothetical protein AN964_03895 [Heyndrickxia shackletonii]|uniref:Uncharacterized protein n=2 Tax=Bacteria TaxID=2 RepID=A0A0Q3WWN9_9BACI|nr:hypothetical protein AN964_03895 [Heyndrickxia shackletonii]